MQRGDSDDAAAGGGSAAAGAPGAAAAGSFRVFSDRSASDLEAFAWNASMDLLACLTAPPDSTLSIYRLLGEDHSPKLLSEKISGVGTALAWSPCGRRIAVGDRLGGVAVYDGETGAVLHARRPHALPVAALSWTEAGGPAVPSPEPAWSRMLPPLLAVPGGAGGMHAAEAPDAEAAGPAPGAAFSLLSSADEGGLLVTSAGGTFTLQASHLFDPCLLGSAVPATPSAEPTAGADVAGLPEALPPLVTRRPRAVRLSPNLRCLAVLLGPAGSAPAASSSAPATGVASPPRTPPAAATQVARRAAGASPGGAVWPAVAGQDGVVVVLDVRKLAVRRRELSLAASMVERLSAVAGYVRRGSDTLAQVWRGGVESFANKMRALAECMEAYSVDEDRSIHQELIATCCSGSPSDALHTFLMNKTSVQQLTRLERGLMQALEYISVVVSTRLELAGHHLLVILHEMKGCAGWVPKFGSIGLDAGPLDELAAQAQEFNRLGELLLIQCSLARRFVRTLFQVLLRLMHKLADQGLSPQEASQVASVGAPTREELDEFIGRLQTGASLELAEITGRIGGAPSRTPPPPTPSGGRGAEVPPDGEACLVGIAHRLLADVARAAERVSAAASSHVGVLACVPVHAPSPWASLQGLPELRAAAAADAAQGVPGPRGMGRTTLSLLWEAVEPPLGARLVVLWSGGGGRQAELHLCRLSITPAPPGAPAPVALERLRLNAGSALAPAGAEVRGDASHFLLCHMYDAGRVVALVLHERAGGGAVACVGLVDISGCDFSPVAALDAVASADAPEAVSADDLPEGSVRRSAALPDSYVWASALSAMAARGVCSVYACRARRLLTLDMEVDEEEEDEDAEVDAAG